MTWTAAIMPDDALPPDSLVGRMLNPDDVPPVFPEDGSPLPVLTENVFTLAEPLPLWRVMSLASERLLDGTFGNATVAECYAAEIEALRDWMPDMPPREFIKQWCRQSGNYDYTIVRNMMEWVCALLTEQARIAREGK